MRLFFVIVVFIALPVYVSAQRHADIGFDHHAIVLDMVMSDGYKYLGSADATVDSKYAISEFRKNGITKLWLEVMTERPGGSNSWKVTDVIIFSRTQGYKELYVGVGQYYCKVNGTEDRTVIAVAAPALGDTEVRPTRSWRIDLRKGRFEVISAKNVLCGRIKVIQIPLGE